MSIFSTTVNDYSFYNMGRIGNDTTDFSQQTLQNTEYANYALSNYFRDNDSKAFSFSLNQPNVFFNGSNGGSSVGSNQIDLDSILHLSSQPSEVSQLSERLFATVPYMGRGSCDPDIETRLMQGDGFMPKKSVNTVSENEYVDYTNYPMLDALKNKVTNPAFMVEESAMNGWVRGGQQSRRND